MMSKRTLPAASFRATCLALLEEVDQTGEEIEVTRRGQLMARLVPAPRARRRPRHFAHLYAYVGDIERPLDDKWETEGS